MTSADRAEARKTTADRDAGRLTWQQAMDLADAVTASGRIIHHGPRLHRTVVQVRFLRWAWRIVDDATSPHRIIAAGHALTERAAWRRVERAHRAELERAATERSGIRDRRPEGLVP